MSTVKKIQKILVVDDDPVQLKLLQETLKTKGYEASTTADASDGLQFAMKSAPDLIILDVMMPIINGYNFCKLLKDNKKDIPVVLLTSRDEQDDIKIGLQMGADAYLTKPVNTNELFRTIQVIENTVRR